MTKALIALTLLLSAPVGATDYVEGDILLDLGNGRWIFQYEGARYSCEVTPMCRGLREVSPFIPSMQFKRDKELINYLTPELEWTDCIVKNCREH